MLSLLHKLAMDHLIPSLFVSHRVEGLRELRPFALFTYLYIIGNEPTGRIAGLVGEVSTWKVEEPQVVAEFDCHGSDSRRQHRPTDPCRRYKLSVAAKCAVVCCLKQVYHDRGDSSNLSMCIEIRKGASVESANQLRIVDTFKQIRGVAPQDAGEGAAEMWETAYTIQKFAKEIQALLGPDPGEASAEVQDDVALGGQNRS